MSREVQLKMFGTERELRYWCRWKRFTDAAGRRRGVGWIVKHLATSAAIRAVFVRTEGQCEHWRLEVER